MVKMKEQRIKIKIPEVVHINKSIKISFLSGRGFFVSLVTTEVSSNHEIQNANEQKISGYVDTISEALNEMQKFLESNKKLNKEVVLFSIPCFYDQVTLEKFKQDSSNAT